MWCELKVFFWTIKISPKSNIKCYHYTLKLLPPSSQFSLFLERAGEGLAGWMLVIRIGVRSQCSADLEQIYKHELFWRALMSFWGLKIWNSDLFFGGRSWERKKEEALTLHPGPARRKRLNTNVEWIFLEIKQNSQHLENSLAHFSPPRFPASRSCDGTELEHIQQNFSIEKWEPVGPVLSQSRLGRPLRSWHPHGSACMNASLNPGHFSFDPQWTSKGSGGQPSAWAPITFVGHMVGVPDFSLWFCPTLAVLDILGIELDTSLSVSVCQSFFQTSK